VTGEATKVNFFLTRLIPPTTMVEEVEDDDIDMEALQARIDLSMAYVHDLVSSWVNPSLKSTKKSGKDAEKELEEYMRRPPR
jgi:hypothetical protein